MNSALETTLAAADATVPAGTSDRIGRFLLLGRLGLGGMGIVFEAYDPQLDRRVAVKVLRYADADTEARARLLREAQAMARLSDAHVVAVHEAGEHDGRVFIAMELVHGETLGQWLNQKPRSRPEIIAAFLQAGRGLAAAHAAGVVHRDFKPDNVLVDTSGRVRVSDFGLARPHGLGGASGDRRNSTATGSSLADALTESGAVLGTPAYMSPEQIMGREAGTASDQFSFCVTLWEALTGARPFEAETLVDLAVKLDSDTPPDSRAPIPRALRAVLLRGLSRKSEDRWPSMNALTDAVGRARARETLRRVTLGVGALALAGAGGVAWDRIREAELIESCRAEGAAVRSVWDDAARDRLTTALGRSGAAIATEVATTVSTALDERQAAWSEARTDLCVARLVESEKAVERLDRRASCIEEYGRAFTATVELLSEPAEGLVLVAPRLPHELPDLRNCSDDEVLEHRATLTRSVPEPVVADVRQRLDRAARLAMLARYQESLEAGHLVLRDADAAGSPVLIAEAQLMLGRVSRKTGDLDGAAHHLESAAEMALLAGHDDVAIAATTKLAFLEGHDREHGQAGLREARLALALVRRFNRTQTPLEADALDTAGSVHFKREEYDAAAQHFEQAIGVWETSLGEMSLGVATSTMNLGNALLLLGDLAGARANYERAIAINSALLGPSHPDVAHSIGNLGALFVEAGDLEAALPHLHRALSLREAAFGPGNISVAESLVNLAEVEREAGEHQQACAHLTRALAIREDAFGRSAPQTIRVMLALGVALEAAGADDQAIEVLAEGLARLPDPGPEAEGDSALRSKIARELTRLRARRPPSGTPG